MCESAMIEINHAISELQAEVAVKLYEVDIVDDDKFFALYQTKIPVLSIETKGAARMVCWPFDHSDITMEMMNTGQ